MILSTAKCSLYTVCNRERRLEVEIENGAVKVAVKDRHDAPRVWVAVGDDDRTERSLTERALNAGESESGTGNERPPASSTLGIRLRGGGLVLGGKGEHLHVLGYTVGPAELVHSLVSRTLLSPRHVFVLTRSWRCAGQGHRALRQGAVGGRLLPLSPSRK